MLGIGDWSVALAYWLNIAVVIICVLNWNNNHFKDGESGDTA
ncbi:hypothetical protein P0136_04485 [Lentisphaerota bacterium ZTH]|nr:hypothetical protein P0136_04485 [Lentisphaerota bacterium ZTH]